MQLYLWVIENQTIASFLTKFINLGIICIPAGGGGTFVGGYLVKKLKLSCSGTMKFCMIASMFAALFTVSFFLSCPNLHFAGITDSYQLNQSQVLDVEKFERYTDGSVSIFNLENQCNKPCFCSRENYEPVRENFKKIFKHNLKKFFFIKMLIHLYC